MHDTTQYARKFFRMYKSSYQQFYQECFRMQNTQLIKDAWHAALLLKIDFLIQCLFSRVNKRIRINYNKNITHSLNSSLVNDPTFSSLEY